MVTVSVVIVSFNTCAVLRDCLQSVYAQEGVSLEVFVVDNHSNDGSCEMVAAEFPQVQLIASETNLGFAAANNVAFRRARGAYVVLLNSDAFLAKGVLRRAVDRMNAAPEVGLAGGLLVGRDGGWQPSARMFPSILNDLLCLSGLAARFPQSRFFGRVDRTWADPREEHFPDWVPGAFSILRTGVLERAGYLDERFFLYYEEVDFCRRIWAAGYRVAYWPELRVVHLGGESSRTVQRLNMSSSGAQLTLWRMRSALLYYRKHHAWQAGAAMLAETLWHRLRLWRNSGGSGSASHAKAEESRTIITLFARAWEETKGGRVCPARPW
jgi:GT2 family glycosyltransferase